MTTKPTPTSQSFATTICPECAGYTVTCSYCGGSGEIVQQPSPARSDMMEAAPVFEVTHRIDGSDFIRGTWLRPQDCQVGDFLYRAARGTQAERPAESAPSGETIDIEAERALFEASEIAHQQACHPQEPLTEKEKAYVLRREPWQRDTYAACGGEWEGWKRRAKLAESIDSSEFRNLLTIYRDADYSQSKSAIAAIVAYIDARRTTAGTANDAMRAAGKYAIRLNEENDALRKQLVERATAGNAAPTCKCGKTMNECVVTSCENAMDTGFATPAATAAPGDLPPLPKPECLVPGVYAYREKAMREYGRACIASNAGAAIPEGFAWPNPPPSKGQSHVLFDDGYTEGWARAIDTVRAMLAAAPSNNSPVGAKEKEQ